ncbi:arsenic resistance protein 2 isoform X2 [Lycorma delicatula]|uniref:arsenic resistance protein 2 isoform X2 n=1 Tax=Lycorma delicatula TaxID=130591 RepID=UPI003F515F97
MGDSDDEYDRKHDRRDKFRGERTESYRGGEGRREDRRRDDWMERNDIDTIIRARKRPYSQGSTNNREAWTGRSRARGDYRGAMRERYSPARQHDMSPPLKRMRTDWDDRRLPYADSGYSYSSWSSSEPQAGYSASNSQRMVDQPETQPPMLTFKAFLQTQDDNITDDEAIRKYNEYKLEFRRQQLNEFFVAHKEEEWFKLKYHPEDSTKRKEEQMAALKKRVEVFMEFMENGRVERVSVDADQSEQLMKLLDAVVIRLEGGTDLDLTILDEAPAENKEVKETTSATTVSTIAANATEIPPKPVIKEEPGLEKEEKEEEKKDVETENGGKEDKSEADEKEDKEKADGEEEEGEENPKEKSPEPEDRKPVIDELLVKENGDNEEEEEATKPADTTNNEEEAMSVDDGECEDREKKEVETDVKDVSVSEEEGEKKVEESENKIKPRALHRTASIFLRNLAPSITKQEVEAMCKRYPGFMRVAIADPQPERRWFRRGWVTFQRDVNIKEICWNLNNIRLRDCELGAIVNRDLSRRIRTVTGLTANKQVIQHDMKLSARIIQNLDAKSGLWQENQQQQEQSFGLVSQNPVLHNITDYLIEEASAEEEELLGQAAETEDTDEKDQTLLKVLDRLLLYLRIVHSVDYYNHCEYPNEDEMPNRCGIMHARATTPTSKVSSQEITEYCRSFQQKMACLVSTDPPIEGDELSALGAKEPDAEVEKFIAANTQELAKDKWLCPLSGKKFKGPEFVRKHIFNKHAEKVEEVKKEVEYFNNYLKDPKRPQLAEHPGNRTSKKDTLNEPPQPAFIPHFHYGGYGGGRGYQHYGGYGGYGVGYPRARGGYNRGGRGGGDYRPVIHYRDLDAPREPDEFI